MRSFGIRRWTLAVVLATTAGVTLAAPASARQVAHFSDQILVGQAVWGSGDPFTGGGTWGMVVAIADPRGPIVFYHESSSTLVECEDGRLAPVGIGRFGEAPANVEISRDLGRATATATLDITTVAYDDCTFALDVIGVDEGVTISMDLLATGRRENSVDRYVESVPHEYRFSSTNRIQARAASGTVLLDGSPVGFDAAQIGRHAWSDHQIVH